MLLKNQRDIYRLLVPALVAVLALSLGSAVIASGPPRSVKCRSTA